MRATMMSPKGLNICIRSLSVTTEDMFPTNMVDVGGCDALVGDAADVGFAQFSELEELLKIVGSQGAAEMDSP